MINVVSQWLPPFLLYCLVLFTRIHEIIRMLPCHTVGVRIALLLATPAAVVSPTLHCVPMSVWTLAVWSVLNCCIYVGLPLWYSRGPWRQRLYMVIHLALIFLISYLLVLALNHVRGKLGYASLPPLMNQACGTVIEIGLIIVLCHATDRYALRIIPRAGNRSFDPFLFFSVLQSFMIGLAVLVISMRGITDPVFIACTFVCACACLLTDLVLGSIIWREHDMRAKQHEADAKQIILDSYVESTANLMQRAETMAKRRHDARNQLAVIQLLAQRGQTEQALRHVDQLREECAQEMRQ
ncbi:hypothetical protein PG2114B_1158 [Bifidobacterium pseudolongum subsp. globosum]|nr:hypothetical protein PG2114B_1158 [Bifidobacterium pseudolongum subsp. globosum]